MKNTLFRRILTLSLAGIIFLSSVSYGATFTKIGDTLVDSSGKIYYLNTVGGVKAYVPIDLSTEGFRNPTNLLQAFTSKIGVTAENGTLANGAAFRYEKLGSGYRNMLKYAAQDGSRRNGEWLVPNIDIADDKHNVIFRYAGLALIGNTSSPLTPTALSAQPITNPNFPSDAYQASGSTNAVSATVYQRNGISGSFSQTLETAYGNADIVYDLDGLYTNGTDGTSYKSAQGIIKSNKATTYNTQKDKARKAFEKWLNSGSDFAQAYKEKAETAIRWNSSLSGLKWWEVLNRYFQINGDPDNDDESLFFYIIGGKLSGHTVYRTYTLPGNITNNVTPTFIGVKDAEGTVLGSSYRYENEADILNGAGEPFIGEPISLEPGKNYQIEAIMSYYSAVRTSSINANRSINFFTIERASNTGMHPLTTLNPTSSPNLSGFYEAGSTDGKGGGSILARNNTGEYRYGGAAFETVTFAIEAGMPANGYLCISVPTAYSSAGDNEVTSDDVLILPYTTGTEIPEAAPFNVSDSYGDMNLGQREYRKFSYFDTETVEDKDNPIYDEDGNPTGEYETREAIFLNESDYGTYTSPGEANIVSREEVDAIDVPTEDRKNIWHEGDGWWTYSEHWPSSLEDIVYKCWLEYEGTWHEGVEEYTRGLGYGLGTTLSRSRGRETVSDPTINVKIYGVSPEEDGELLYTYNAKPGSVGEYGQRSTVNSSLTAPAEYPRIRVEMEIDKLHDESGIFGGAQRAPYNNARQDEHDSVVRVFEAEPDDMAIKEIEVRDSENVVVLHAENDGTGNLVVDVEGVYDREEDLTMKVVVEQTYSANHNVHSPSIDVRVYGINEDGDDYITYINQTETIDGLVMGGEGDTVVFDGIQFRAKDSHAITFNININDRHSYGEWNENVWDSGEDSFSRTLSASKGDMALRQNIELYTSKNNPQNYLTFAERLNFKYAVEHKGDSIQQSAIIGGSKISPYAKINTNVLNADALTLIPTTGSLMYGNALRDDPAAEDAVLMSGDSTAATRLYPGLGSGGYASHVQLWMNNFVVPSHTVNSGNVAAYGHLLVTGEIDKIFDTLEYNIRDSITDYVQKEFIGEKNFKIKAVAANVRNAVAKDAKISVEVAVENMPSSYNDQTIVDRTYLDILVDGEVVNTIEIEVPVGETIVTEAIVDKPVFLETKTDPKTGNTITSAKDKVEVEARVNWGEHQTHYEYVLKKTDSSLFPDPFVDNSLTTVVKPNLPDETKFPAIEIDDTLMGPEIFFDDSVNDYAETISDPESDTYKLHYDANNGSGATADTEVNYNSSVPLGNALFDRPGYILKGWNTKPNGEGVSYKLGQVISIGPKNSYPKDNTVLSLYAIWEPCKYKLRFHARGGSGKMDEMTMTYDAPEFLPECGFTKEGYVFLGWSTKEDGSGDLIDNGSRVSNLSSGNGTTVDLYAVWLATDDCVIIEEIDKVKAVNLVTGESIDENPSVQSFAENDTYAFISIRIPTVLARKSGDLVPKVYDLLEPNWNYTDWIKVSENISDTAGVPSEYIFAYKSKLKGVDTTERNPKNSDRPANRTTDVFTKVKVGDFTSTGTFHGQAMLVAAIVEADALIASPEDALPAAIQLFNENR